MKHATRDLVSVWPCESNIWQSPLGKTKRFLYFPLLGGLFNESTMRGMNSQRLEVNSSDQLIIKMSWILYLDKIRQNPLGKP